MAHTLPTTVVHKAVLTTGAQFEEYVEGIGRPRFAICSVSEDDTGARALPDEWFFSEDMESLMSVLLDWDARGIHMEVEHSVADDGRSIDTWNVVGLPAYFNDAALSLNYGMLGITDKITDEKEARSAYLQAVFNEASTYEFIALRSMRYDSFVEEWKSDDDKKIRPEYYRSQKRFGVIVDAGGLGIEEGSLQYWVYIGAASGSLTARQLQAAGLTRDGLIGQSCVINGLGEVERIGNHKLT